MLRPFSCHVHELFVSWSIIVDGNLIIRTEVCSGLMTGFYLYANLPGTFGLYILLSSFSQWRAVPPLFIGVCMSGDERDLICMKRWVGYQTLAVY
jgi:hypothetical protein